MKRRYPYGKRGTFSASWIESFKFTNAQRKSLVATLVSKQEVISTLEEHGNPSKKALKAHAYIDRVELEIPRWKAISEKDYKEATQPTEYKAQVVRYYDAVNELQAAYQALNNDVFAGIDGFTRDNLIIEPNPRNKRLGGALADAVASGLPAGAVALGDADDFIKDLLELMRDSAQRAVKNIELPTGTRNQHIKNLVNALVEIYLYTFEKIPSPHSGTIFRRFTTALAPMLYVEIGENTLKKVIDKYK
jgi:hypothetical protein